MLLLQENHKILKKDEKMSKMPKTLAVVGGGDLKGFSLTNLIRRFANV